MTFRTLKWLIAGGVAVGTVLGVMLVGYLLYLNTQLPPVAKLENPEYSLPTVIYDRHGQVVDEIFIKRRKLVSYDQLPAHLINGLIAKEDSRFFDHHGIDPLRMVKAFWVNLTAFRTVQGASTLTQQTARQFFLTLERTWERKLKEILLALKIERQFTKEEILTLYLNKVNFGDAWGVSAAAQVYFDKPVEDLSLPESALLVGLLPAPNRYKPTRNPHLARQQRNIVLQRMYEEGFIPRSQMMASASEPIVLAEPEDPTVEAVAYYVEHVRRILLERFGSKSLYEGGLHVYTAMDLAYQTAAHKALLDGVRAVDRRRGYRGPIENIALDEVGEVPEETLLSLNPGRVLEIGKTFQGVVVEVNDEPAEPEPANEGEPPAEGEEAPVQGPYARVVVGPDQSGLILWEQLKEDWQVWREPPPEDKPDAEARIHPVNKLSDILAPGDLIEVEVRGLDAATGEYTFNLYQEPEANGALYAMEPETGEVMALVGGTRFGRGEGGSEFIRATQAKRQPGSAFKPVIYAAAIEEGYTPATQLDDSPRVFTLRTGKKHIPQNYDNRYLGRVSLREALVRSRNVPTVQLVDEMGPRTVIEYAHKFGISTPIPEESIIALGTHSVKLSELTRAYAVFAAGGERPEPIYIQRIENAEGEVLLEREPERERVITEATAYLVADLLRDVVRSPWGTGHRAMEGFERPAAGKTGTTQDYTDAWYLGFIPQLVAGVYVGFDDPSVSLGPSETGSRAAAPVWKDFMMRVEGSLPVETFSQPDTVVALRVGPGGNPIGPCDEVSGSHFELFKASSVPQRLRSMRDDCFNPALSGDAPPPPPEGGEQPSGPARENVEL